MRTKIQKWGNSLGLRIPRAFAAEAKVGEGSTVELTVENGTLLVRLVDGHRFELEELLKGINKQNLHGEVSTGAAVGRESW